MRLTTPTAFVRFLAAHHESDFERLSDWIDRLETWFKAGIENIFFFIHQSTEGDAPLLASYFVEKLNDRLDCSLPVPTRLKA
jgi:hypothetical protein